MSVDTDVPERSLSPDQSEKTTCELPLAAKAALPETEGQFKARESAYRTSLCGLCLRLCLSELLKKDQLFAAKAHERCPGRMELPL